MPVLTRNVQRDQSQIESEINSIEDQNATNAARSENDGGTGGSGGRGDGSEGAHTTPDDGFAAEASSSTTRDPRDRMVTAPNEDGELQTMTVKQFMQTGSLIKMTRGDGEIGIDEYRRVKRLKEVTVQHGNGDTEVYPPMESESLVMNVETGDLESVGDEAIANRIHEAEKLEANPDANKSADPLVKGMAGTAVASSGLLVFQAVKAGPGEEPKAALANLDGKPVVEGAVKEYLATTNDSGKPVVGSHSVLRLDDAALEMIQKEGLKIQSAGDRPGESIEFTPDENRRYLVLNEKTGKASAMTEDEVAKRIKQGEELVENQGKQVIQTSGFSALLMRLGGNHEPSTSGFDVDKHLRDLGAKTAAQVTPEMKAWQTTNLGKERDTRERAYQSFEQARSQMLSDPDVRAAYEKVKQLDKAKQNGNLAEDGRKLAEARKGLEHTLNGKGFTDEGGPFDQMRSSMDEFNDSMAQTNKRFETAKEWLTDDQKKEFLGRAEEQGKFMNESFAELSMDSKEGDEERLKMLKEMVEKASEIARMIAEKLGLGGPKAG